MTPRTLGRATAALLCTALLAAFAHGRADVQTLRTGPGEIMSAPAVATPDPPPSTEPPGSTEPPPPPRDPGPDDTSAANAPRQSTGTGAGRAGGLATSPFNSSSPAGSSGVGSPTTAAPGDVPGTTA